MSRGLQLAATRRNRVALILSRCAQVTAADGAMSRAQLPTMYTVGVDTAGSESGRPGPRFPARDHVHSVKSPSTMKNWSLSIPDVVGNPPFPACRRIHAIYGRPPAVHPSAAVARRRLDVYSPDSLRHNHQTGHTTAGSVGIATLNPHKENHAAAERGGAHREERTGGSAGVASATPDRIPGRALEVRQVESQAHRMRLDPYPAISATWTPRPRVPATHPGLESMTARLCCGRQMRLPRSGMRRPRTFTSPSRNPDAYRLVDMPDQPERVRVTDNTFKELRPLAGTRLGPGVLTRGTSHAGAVAPGTTFSTLFELWSGRRDSNPVPSSPRPTR